jgi:hypothetical protein
MPEIVEEGVTATAVHPIREYTPEERAHLGLPPIEETP